MHASPPSPCRHRDSEVDRGRDAARQRFALLAADRRPPRPGATGWPPASRPCSPPSAARRRSRSLLLGFRRWRPGSWPSALVTAVGLATAAVLPASGLRLRCPRRPGRHSHLVRLADIWALAPGRRRRVELEGAVELRGSAYPAAPPGPSRDVSLRIAPGSTSPSSVAPAAAKSTLVKVLVGLLAPSAGEVRVRRSPGVVAEPARPAARDGRVLQEVWLFAGTIRDNITVERRLTDDVRRGGAGGSPTALSRRCRWATTRAWRTAAPASPAGSGSGSSPEALAHRPRRGARRGHQPPRRRQQRPGWPTR